MPGGWESACAASNHLLFPSGFASSRQPNRQAFDRFPSSGQHGITQRGRNRWYPCLLDPAQRSAAADDRHFDLGRFTEREQAIRIEVLLLHPAVLEGDLAVQ